MVLLQDWLGEHARPITLDPAGPLPRLGTALTDAAIVGLAVAARGTRELSQATHVLLRALVDQGGFRSVAIEGTEAPYDTAAALDRFVTTGHGNPRRLLGSSQSFLHTVEALDVIGWLRIWNQQHPDDPLRVVHCRGPITEPASLAEVEGDLARRDLAWHAATGQRVVHWGGTAHLVAAQARTLGTDPALTHPNAGGQMRARLGSGYAVVALTFGSGTVPHDVPPLPADFTEAPLDTTPSDAVLLDLHDTGQPPPPVTDWLSRPLRTRCIGPDYDPTNDRASRVEAGPVAASVDAFAHVHHVRPATPL